MKLFRSRFFHSSTPRAARGVRVMEHLRSAADVEWTHESDTALLNEMRALSGRILARVNATKNAVDALASEGEQCQVRVRDVSNRFRQLADLTHVERRVGEDTEDNSRRASIDASTSGARHEASQTPESSSVESKYRIALRVTINTTRGRWLLPKPMKVDEGEESQGVDEGTDYERNKHPGDKTDQALPPSHPPPKLIGNRFFRPLPHVIGTRHFYHDENVCVDWSHDIAPDEATANAVMGVDDKSKTTQEKTGASFGTYEWDPRGVNVELYNSDDGEDEDDGVSVDLSASGFSEFSEYSNTDGNYDACDTHHDGYVHGSVDEFVGRASDVVSPSAPSERHFSDASVADASVSQMGNPPRDLARINTAKMHRSPSYHKVRMSPNRVRRTEKSRNSRDPSLSPKVNENKNTSPLDFKAMMEAKLRDPELNAESSARFFVEGKRELNSLLAQTEASGVTSKEPPRGGLFDDDDDDVSKKEKQVPLSVSALAFGVAETSQPGLGLSKRGGSSEGLFDDDDGVGNKPKLGLFDDE